LHLTRFLRVLRQNRQGNNLADNSTVALDPFFKGIATSSFSSFNKILISLHFTRFLRVLRLNYTFPDYVI